MALASTSPTPTPTSRSRGARRGPGRPLEPGGHRRASRDHRRRRAQPVLPAGTQHRAGTQLGGVHDRVPDPLRRRRDCQVRQAGCAGAGSDARRAGPLQRRAAAQAGRLGVEHAAAAAAGTSTSTARTRCCGVATPGSTGWPRARSSPTNTSSSAWVRAARPAPGAKLRPPAQQLAEGLGGRVHAGIVVGGHQIQQ